MAISLKHLKVKHLKTVRLVIKKYREEGLQKLESVNEIKCHLGFGSIVDCLLCVSAKRNCNNCICDYIYKRVGMKHFNNNHYCIHFRAYEHLYRAKIKESAIKACVEIADGLERYLKLYMKKMGIENI